MCIRDRDSGTGCVHTAPGFGVEDFEVCQNYPDIGIVVPVNSVGRMTAEAGKFEGLTTTVANKAIKEDLIASNSLLASEHIEHQYPHCWRCKEPVLFRATEQWFCSIDGFKDQALKAIEDVEWIPAWGEGRIRNMVNDRSDWCISRQRTWGVPIPIFYCEDCGEPYITKESIQAVADLFRKEGSDGWYLHEAAEILPAGTKCAKCGGTHFRKEKDIMDVWFDSGSSHAAVLTEENGLHWPCDLYIEGADQYRGWFQSSLLTAVATRGSAPYKTCCSCGWVVDGEGRKMSKSLANGTAPEKIINQYGADILRLWVASSDYHSDVRISFEYLKQLSEGYRKIRNTARYILGNISDFHPDTDSVPSVSYTHLGAEKQAAGRAGGGSSPQNRRLYRGGCRAAPFFGDGCSVETRQGGDFTPDRQNSFLRGGIKTKRACSFWRSGETASRAYRPAMGQASSGVPSRKNAGFCC